MLHEFLRSNRVEILGLSRKKLTASRSPSPTEAELAHGLPIFLDQLIAILQVGKADREAGHSSVSQRAGLHGGELLRMGLSVGQVVQDYGSICQSVTELADDRQQAITADEFQTFNRCLDEAMAQAVTEYQHQRDRTVVDSGVMHLGFLAHEMRNLLSTSILTFDALARGKVGVGGSTGALLGRSLGRMRGLIDRTLAEVRLEAGTQKTQRVSIASLIEEIEIIATIEPKDKEIQFSVDAGAPDLAVDGDFQILIAVLANLVQNAFKFSHHRGHVTVRARADGGRVLIEVEDECGGLPPGKIEELFQPFEQRGRDQTGLGLGLSICLRGARASGGEIHIRDLPGSGCVFTIDLPRAAAALPRAS